MDGRPFAYTTRETTGAGWERMEERKQGRRPSHCVALIHFLLTTILQ